KLPHYTTPPRRVIGVSANTHLRRPAFVPRFEAAAKRHLPGTGHFLGTPTRSPSPTKGERDLYNVELGQGVEYALVYRLLAAECLDLPPEIGAIYLRIVVQQRVKALHILDQLQRRVCLKAHGDRGLGVAGANQSPPILEQGARA